MGGGSSKAKQKAEQAAKAEQEAKAKAADEREKELSRREAEIATKEQELATREASLTQVQKQEDPLNQSGLAPLPSRRSSQQVQGSRLSTAEPSSDGRKGSMVSSQGDSRRRIRRKSMFFAEKIDVEKLTAPPTAASDAHHQQVEDSTGRGGALDAWLPGPVRPSGQPVPESAHEERSLRVFVCSSLDGVHEHALLHRTVYPRLASDAARRGVALRVVDLRDDRLSFHENDITDDAGAALLLDQMLHEADRCAPWFVGLFGEAYPDVVGDEIAQMIKGLGAGDWARDSEAEHGPLAEAAAPDVIARRGALARRGAWCAVMLQRGAAVQVVFDPSEVRVGAAVQARGEDISAWAAEVERESGGRGAAGEFEARLVRGGLPVVVCAARARVVEAVYAEVRSFLDQAFPADGTLVTQFTEKAGGSGGWFKSVGRGFRADAGDMRREERAAAAYQRACEAACVGPSDKLARALSEHCGLAGGGAPAGGETKPFVVIDGGGGGTVSPSLAVWALRLARETRGRGEVVYHRLGLMSGPCAVGRELLVVLRAVRRAYGLLEELPREEGAHEALREWLIMAGRARPLVLVLDGLDLLADGMGGRATGLWTWLPEHVPPGCRVVVGVDDDKRTGFQTLKLVSKWGAKKKLSALSAASAFAGGLSAPEAAPFGASMNSMPSVKSMVEGSFKGPPPPEEGEGAGQDPDLEVVDQERFCYVLAGNQPARARAAAWRRLRASVSGGGAPPREGEAEGEELDWADEAAAKVGPGLVAMVVASMVMRRHAAMFRASGGGQAAALAGAGPSDIATCEAWPEDATDVVLERAFVHVTRVVAKRGIPETAPGELLMILAESYCGVDEYRLSDALKLSALHFSILLRELSPYLMEASGVFFLFGPVRRATLKHYAGRPHPPLANPYVSPPKDHPHMLQQHDEVCVAEALAEHMPAKDRRAQLRSLATDTGFFVRARHSSYFARYRSAWATLAAEEGAVDIAAELRTSAQHYTAVTGSDGAPVESELLAKELALCHCLMVTHFLAVDAAQPGQAMKLLNELRPAVAEGGPCPNFLVAFWREYAVVHHENGDEANAVEVLKDALAKQTEPGLPLRDPQRAPQDWRDRAYVVGYLEDAHVAARRLLAELCYSTGALRESEQLYTGVISTLKDALADSARVELELGKVEWAAAKLSKENVKHEEAMSRGQSAQKRLHKTLYPEHPLCKQVDEFVAALDRRQKQEMQAAGGADVDALLQGSDMLKDLGAQDDDNLDSVTAGETAHIPVLQQEFEAQYSKGHLRMAHKVAFKLLCTVEANVDTGTHEEDWCSAAIMLAKVLSKRGLYTQSVEMLEQVIEARVHRADSDGDLKLIFPRIEQAIVLIMQGNYERAYETVRRFEGWHLMENLGNDHPAVIRMQYAQAIMLVAQGAQSEALEQLKAVKEKQLSTLVHYHEELLGTQVQLAELQVRMSLFEDASKGVEALGSTIEKHLGTQAFAMSEVRYLQGWLMLLAGDYKGSDDFLREAARIASLTVGKPLGEDGKVRVHPMVVTSSAKIAEKSMSQGRFDEARNIYDTVLKSFYATELKPTSLSFAELQEVYASLCERTGRPIESLQRLQEASEIRQLVPGMHADAMVHSNVLLAQQEINMGNYRGARETVDSTLIILEKATFCPRLDKCSLSHLQAQLAFLVEVDLDGADAHYKEAISLQQALVGEAHPSVALLQLEHAYILMEKKDFEGVDSQLKVANSTITLTFGKATGHLSAVHRLQGLVHRNKGKYEEADYVLQSALLVDGSRDWAAAFIAGDYARPPQPRTVQVVQDLEAMGRVQYRRGHFEAADHMLKHMHSVSLSLYGEDAEHPTTARALVGLSDLRVEYGQYVEAEALCRKGLDMQKKILSTKHPHTLRTMEQYSRILHLCGDFENAANLLKDIKQGLTAFLGKEHLQVRLIDARLAMIQYAMGIQKRPRAPLIQCLALIESKIIKAPAAGAGKAKPAAAKKNPANPMKGDAKAGAPAADLKISLLDKDRAQILLWLAEVDIDVFKLMRAGQFLRMAEDCYKRMGKTGEPMVGVCKTRHADISFLRGRLSVALSMYRQASAIKKRSFWGSDHPELAEDEEGMARVHVARAMYDEAEERYQRALELTDNRMATRNARRGGTLALIAELMQTIGRYDDAEEMLATSRELQMGFTTRSKASVLGLFREGSLCVSRGHYQAAKKHMEQVISQGQLHTSCRDAMRCSVLVEVGFAEVGQRRFGRANEALRAARAALESAHAGLPGNRSEADKKVMLQNVVGRASKYTKVTRTFIQTIIPHAWKQQRNYGMYPVRARLMMLEAKVDLELGRLEKAEVGLRRLIDIYEAEDKSTQGRESPHPGIAECKSYLAQVKFALGEYPESESLFLSAKDGKWLAGWEGTCTSHAIDAEGLCRLARVFARYDDATDLLRQARDCRMLAVGDEDTTSDVVVLDILEVGMQVERGQYGLLNDSVETSLADEARKLSLLKQSFLFDKFMDGDRHAKDRVLQQVAGACTVRSFKEMEVIADQGARDPALYIVSSGAMAVCVAAQGGGGGNEDEATDTEVSRLRAGDSVGEFCLLFGDSWAASLVAMSSGEALCLSHKAIVTALKAADSAPDTVAAAVAAQDQVWKLQGLMRGRGDPPVPDSPEVIADRIRKAYKIEKAAASARQQRRRSSVTGGGGDTGRSKRRGSIAFEGIGGLPSHPGLKKESSLLQDIVIEEKPEERKTPSPSELLALAQKLCGPETVTTTSALLLSGLTACVRFSWTAAVDFFDRAHETVSKSYFGCWHNSPGEITANYSRVLLVLGRREEALELLSLDLNVAERTYGATHPNMMPLFVATAAAHFDAGDSTQTLEWINRALTLAKKFYGTGSPVASAVMSMVARTTAMKGSMVEPISNLEKARSQKLRGGWLEGEASVVDDLEALAESLIVVGRFDEAESALVKVALARQEFAHKGALKAAAGITVEGLRMRSSVLQGRLEDGVKIARRMIDAETKAEGEVFDMQHILVEARRVLGEYGLRTGRSEDAVGNLIKAVTICTTRYSEGHPSNVGAVLHYARIRALVDFKDRKGLADAEDAVATANSWLVNFHGENHPLMCEVNLANAAIHSAYFRRPTAIECIEKAQKMYQELYEGAAGRARKKGARISLSREGPRSPEMPIAEEQEEFHEEEDADWSFMVAVCQLELAKLYSVNGLHATALQHLTDYYSACDYLFASDKDTLNASMSSELGKTLGDNTARYFNETPRDNVPLIPLFENGLTGGRSLNRPPERALDLRIHVSGAFGWLEEEEEEEEDMVSPLAQNNRRFSVMRGNSSPFSRQSSQGGTHRSMTSTISPLTGRMASRKVSLKADASTRRGSTHISSPMRTLGRESSGRSPMWQSPMARSSAQRSPVFRNSQPIGRAPSGFTSGDPLTARTSGSVVSRDSIMYSKAEDPNDMYGGAGGQAGNLWVKIMSDTVDWDALKFEPPRLVELDALMCQAQLLLRMSRFGDAFSTLLHLEAGLEALKLQRHPYARESEVLKAHCLLGASRYEEAESMFEYLLSPTPEDRIKDPLSGSLLRGAASIKEVLKDLSRAAVLYKQAAAMYAESAGTSDMPDVYECELAALRVRWHAGLLPDAYVGMQRNIESLERLVGKDHPSVSVALIDYADVLVSDREYDTCESLYMKAHTALSERCGDDHPMTARCVASLAMLHHLAGPASRHYKDVTEKMEEALEVLVQRLGRNHAALCPILDNYGKVCADRGQHEKAAELRHWSIQVLTATHGLNNHLVDAERERLVASLLAQGKVQEGRAMYANILEGREKAKGNDAVELCPLLVLMARLEMGDNQHPVAERLLKRSLAIKQKHHTVTLSKEDRLAKDRGARMLRAGGKRNSVYKDTTSHYHVECVPELTGLAEVCSATEEFKDSEGYYLSCLAAQKGRVVEVTEAEKKVGAGHTHALEQAKALSTEAKLAVAMTKRAMSSMFALKGDLQDAEQWGRQALADVVSVLGAEHPRCLAIKTTLAGLYRAQAEHVEAQRLYLDTGVS